MRYGIVQAILVTAAAAVLAQTLLIRELVVTFYGNELTIALMISAWLFWGALGSTLAGRWLRKHSPRTSDYAWGQLAIAAALPLELLLVRAVKPALSIAAGELTDPITMLVTSLVLLAPISIINGFQFGLGVRIAADQRSRDPIGRVYGLEALGNLIGAAGFGYVLVYVASPVASIAGASVCSMLSAALLARLEHRRVLAPVAGLAGAVLISALVLIGLNNIERATKQWAWPGLEVVASGSSIYGDISVVRYGSMHNVYENGVLSFSFPLPLQAEEQVHVTMGQIFQHRRLLVIGGGTAGVLREILKYPVTEVYYLELDPNLTGLVQPLLPTGDQQAALDPRVRSQTGDARRFVKTWQGAGFDAVLINVGDPVTVFLNRFYTREFFAELSRIVTHGGVVRLSIASNESYLAGTTLEYNGSVYNALRTSFRYVKAIPGDRLVLFASTDSSTLSLDPLVLARRIETCSIPTQFMNEDYLSTRLSIQRIDHAERRLESEPCSNVNEDLRPTAFYLALASWSGHFGPRLPGILKTLPGVRIEWLVGLVGALCIAAALSKERRTNLTTLSVALMGFAGMAGVTTAVLGFQTVFGHVYHRVGLLSAGFMLGLFLGTKLAGRLPAHAGRPAFAWIMVGGALYWMFLYLALFWLTRSTPPPALNHLFPVSTMVDGILVGSGFVMANRITLADHRSRGPTPTTLYAADLLGGAVAGLVLTTVILPGNGVPGLCLLMVLSLCITSFITLILPNK